MRRTTSPKPADTRPDQLGIGPAPDEVGEFPNRLLTASEVA